MSGGRREGRSRGGSAGALALVSAAAVLLLAACAAASGSAAGSGSGVPSAAGTVFVVTADPRASAGPASMVPAPVTSTPVSSTTTPPVPVSSAPTPSQPPGADVVSAAVQRVAPALQQAFPDAYADAAADLDGGRVVVYRLPGHPEVESAARSAAQGVAVAFVDARYGFRSMSRLRERITSDTAYWQQQGVKLVSVGATDGTAVQAVVGTYLGSADEQRLFDARYGAGAVSVRAQRPGIGF
ncbi:hypothetical protein GCM10009665_70670 [Kitasatospora nipponensis]|uniref:Uncharacterized protein n=1 Tax=Kitasatospora nipponensis TaxID=258049 RepID=A0ABN1WZ14_9ACTN